MIKTIFLVIIILFVLFVILNAVISSVDEKGDGKLYKEEGSVVGKSYLPTHTRLLGNSVIHRFPDEWSIDVKLSNDTVNVSVLEKFYNDANINDLVTVEFKRGKLSNQIYPLNVKKK